MPIEEYRVFYAGKELKEGQHFSFYSIPEGSYIDVVRRLCMHSLHLHAFSAPSQGDSISQHLLEHTGKYEASSKGYEGNPQCHP